MTTPNDPTMSHDSLDAVIAAYMLAVEAGDVPNRQELLDQHPEHADALRAFFADLDRMDRVASPLRVAGGLDETGAADANGHTALPTVRYFGDYELLEEIARGGMGIVYKARQVSLNRLVALKMILAGSFASSREIQRFRSEAEAAANLDHPHIVPIHEVGEHDGQQYYSMKFVEGTSLAAQSRGDPRREVEATIGVIRAVHHAHQRGVLHRDLKPSNVLVDSQGTRMVADFGLAKRLATGDRSITETGQVLGAPKYMAPEQAAGRKDLTIAADVYSLGVILYERLTGRTPFTGDNALTLLRQAREAEPPRPSSIRPGLNRDLETVVLKCLEKESSRRYASARALAEDLESWLAGRPITARPAGQAERLWRWCKRNPAIASSLAAALLALVSTIGVSIAFAITRTQAAKRLTAAYNHSEEYRIQAQIYAADALSEQGSSLVRRGDAVMGLFQLVRALEIAPAEREDVQLPVRRVIAAATVRFREAARSLEGDGYFTSAALSPDGKFLVTGDHDGRARIYESRSGRLLHEVSLFREGGCQRIAFSGDSAAFASTNGSEIRTWAIAGRHALGPPASLSTLASPTTVLQIPALKTEMSLSLNVTYLSFNADNSSILAATEYWHSRSGNGIAQLWDVGTGKPVGPVITWKSGSGFAEAIFRPDGAAVAIADHDKGPVKLIDMRTGRLKGEQISVEPGTSLTPAFSPDNKAMAFLGDGHLRVYDANTARPISSSTSGRQGAPRGYGPCFSRDGRTLFSQGENDVFYIWNIDTQRERAVDVPFSEGEPAPEPFDTGSIAVVNEGGECLILDTQTAHLLATTKGPSFEYSIAFDPTGLNLAFSLLRKPMTRRREPSLFDSELWSLGPIAGPPDIVRQWAVLLTRSEIREAKQVEALDELTWQDRRQTLAGRLRTPQVSEIVRRVTADPLYWLRCELGLAEQTRRWNDVVRLLTRLIEAEPGQWRHHQRLGNALGWLGHYQDAAFVFQRANKITGSGAQKDLNWWTCTGLSLLASGDEKGYTALCQEMVERVSDPRQGAWSLRLLTGGPSALAGGKPPVERFLNRVATDPSSRSSCTGALLIMRSGRFLEEDLRELESVLQEGGVSWSSFVSLDEDFGRSDLPPFLAIAHHRLGHASEARKYLNEARSHLRKVEADRSTTWERVLSIKLVTREAEALIERVNDNLPMDPFAH